MKIGILRESKKPPDTRVPLTPGQCRYIIQNYPGIRISVQPSPFRCFSDEQYHEEGICLTNDLNDCDILMGVKEVATDLLIPDKTYFFFSHTIKKQNHNRNLLKAILEKKIRLIDYELITDDKGIRLIGFGRWAGIVGAYHGIRAFCLKNGTGTLPPPQNLQSLDEIFKAVGRQVLPPVRLVITGGGRVAKGAEEIMQHAGIEKMPAEEFLKADSLARPVYVQLDPGDYNRHKSGKHFDLYHYFRAPEKYESNFDRFGSRADILIMAAFWNPKAPLLFTKEDMRGKKFSIRVIADITCDMNGSVPSTIQTSTFENPYYDYNPFTDKAETAFSDPGNITVMAIDNLPCGLPREASADFGEMITAHIIPQLVKNDPHDNLERATISIHGDLTAPFSYLYDWVFQPH